MSMDNPSGEAATPAPGVEGEPASLASPVETAAAETTLPEVSAAAPSEAAPEAPASEAEAPAPEAGSLVEAAPEAKPDAEAPKPEGEAQPEQVAEPVTYEAFNFPEGVTANDADLAPFTEALGKHGATQEFGQELIDLHTAQLQQYANNLQQHQIDTFAKTRDDWRKEFEAGAGNQRDTILADAKSAINVAVPDEAARKALWDVMSFTGAGDNPHIIRAFATLGAKLRERSAPPPPLPTNPARTGRPEDRRYSASAQR